MELRPTTSQERRLLFIEALLNETDKVSKVAPESVLSGLAAGVSKVAGKAEKDIILALSELFADLSYGSKLDRVAKNFGFPQRQGSLGSSTYIRITADPGTVYAPGTHVFTSTEGFQFSLDQSITIGALGFGYVKVSSLGQGSRANVGALTINKVTPQPAGHLNVINETRADWGRDEESDELLRIRIQDGANVLARGTLSMIEQLAQYINPKILRVFNYGVSQNGKTVLAIVTQNGSDLTLNELGVITQAVSPYLCLTDARWAGYNYIGVEFRNVEYFPIDLSFRALLDNTVNPDDIRIAIQVAISKYLDFRNFDPVKDKVEWDNLLQIVKNTEGVKYVPDQFFYPRTDIAVSTYKLPRLRGFLMLNLDGTIVSNLSGTLSPVFYPAEADFSYISTALQTL